MRFPVPYALSAAFHAGADASFDPRRAKRIILSNQISLSIAALSLPFILIYLASGEGLMGWLEIPIFLGYASVHRFNRAGRTWFARFFLITLANLDVLGYSLSMGTETGQHLFFLLAGWTPLVLFEWEERKSIIYGITLSSALLLATEALAPARGLLAPVPLSDLRQLRLTEMFTLQAVEILLIFYFFRGNRATELALALAGAAARSADEAKSRFLTRMSGAIRAPLEEILGVSHLLIKSGAGPERRSTLEDIQAAAGDLLAIVDELVDLSRIEAGKMRLEPAPFSPLRLGHQVLRPFEIEAARKGLALSLQPDPALPPRLSGDAARLKQVLRNLVGNACKFTEAGEVILRLGYRPAGLSGSPSLICEVADTGIGIPENVRARLFEPFAQGDASTSRQYGGTGLGLFICKQIVDLMGGAISFSSGAAGGTVFRFHVPLPMVAPDPLEEKEPAAESKAAEASMSAAQAPAALHVAVQSRMERGPKGAPEPLFGETPSGGLRAGSGSPEKPLPASVPSLRVLVVDDHPMNRKLLVQFLAGYGITPDTAGSGQETLDACAAKAYHVVFLDCHMPGMDGYACARNLNEKPPPGGRPILIGVTAEAPESALRRCLEAGMDDLLPKPILEGRLRALVAACATPR
ncbi:MAG: response regulator [Fibrobacteres bacterium]|nr:response regulator [Fibrobacterota bacterium]